MKLKHKIDYEIVIVCLLGLLSIFAFIRFLKSGDTVLTVASYCFTAFCYYMIGAKQGYEHGKKM